MILFTYTDTVIIDPHAVISLSCMHVAAVFIASLNYNLSAIPPACNLQDYY